jgi:riboflavin kinase/FMN adenylyltransferase
VTVEPWILDFSGDLYGRELRLEFFRFLRPETKFETLTALQQQIHQDAAETRRYFENI